MKQYIILLFFVCILSGLSAYGNNIDGYAPTNSPEIQPQASRLEYYAGSVSNPFTYTHTQDLTSGSSNWGYRPFNDVFYKFTLNRSMNIRILHEGSQLDDTCMSLLTSSLSSINYGCGNVNTNGHPVIEYANLAAGTYYVVSEGSISNGIITTTIEFGAENLGMPRPVYIGSKNEPFSYTHTQDTRNCGNTWPVRPTNDIHYKVKIEKTMDLIISHCGSALTNTCVTMVNANNSSQVWSSCSSGGKCNSAGNAELAVENVPAGTYTIISEGATQNGVILTSVQGKLPAPTVSGTTMQNYIQARSYLYQTNSEYMEATQYFDGLGRLTQTVQKAITPHTDAAQRKDLVSLLEYDIYGRELNQWLPAAVAGNRGAFVAPASIIAAAKTTNSNNGTPDQKPYSKTVYEDSPLHRTKKQFAPGASWQSLLAERAVETEYLTNSGTSGDLACALFSIDGTGATTKVKKDAAKPFYANNLLFVTKVTDEDGNIIYEFRDKMDRVVLSRQINVNTSGTRETLDTYFVYNDCGKLCFVLPPMASEILVANNGSWDENNSTPVKQYAYLYKYDNRQRCIAKKLPGCEKSYYIYDKADQLIFSQDGEQFAKNPKEWTFSIPDAFGRIVLTGTCKNSLDYTADPLKTVVARATWAKTTNTYKGYTITLTLTSPTILSANYFDNYEFLGLNDIPNDANTQYNAESGYATRYTGGYKGLATGTWNAIIGSSSGFTYSAFYYDQMGLLIQAKSKNHLGGTEKEYTAYNFSGNPTSKKMIHTYGSNSYTQVYTYSYDYAGRLSQTKHKLNSGAEVILSDNTYDDLGRLKTTQANAHANLKTTYGYNVRSWTKTISGPLFSQTLYYNESYGGSAVRFNGNISAINWTVSGDRNRGYAFAYDNLSRLTAANYLENGAANTNYKVSYSYDKHGNIKTLQRYGKTTASAYGSIDNLTMNYAGNQLIKTEDAIGIISLAESADFKNYANVATEYTYNKNGSLDKDLNKGITGILYNPLNLPQELAVKNTSAVGKTYYIYSSGGNKLRTIHKTTSNLAYTPVLGSTSGDANFNISKTTDYAGSIIYENNTLKRILISNGYIEGGVYYFYLNDHLGNNRVVANASGTVIQKTHYYPFGMAFAEGTKAEQSKQPYKYGNKELDDTHGLNIYDFEARYSDPALGNRFWMVDPMAEKYYSISAYVYCNNNPIKFIDPTGMYYDDYYSSLNGRYLGNDNMPSTHMRLIDDIRFNQIKNDANLNIMQKGQTLQTVGMEITINDVQIQADMQDVADLSSSQNTNGQYQEHQIYLTLDRSTATISSYVGNPGTHNQTILEYFPAPATGVNFVDRPGGLVLIGQVHGHPPTNIPGMVTAKTMSQNFDVPTSATVNVPIYGIDAMDGPTNGNPAAIHRVIPDGTITNNIGRTSSGFNIGQDAMRIWGKRR